MIDLKKTSGFYEDIEEFISERRAKQKIPQASNYKQNARLLNEERDGCIVYTWDDVSEGFEGAVVTHFGLYNPSTKKHQVVHTYNQRVYVVSASVNQERTLMGFTTMTKDGLSGNSDTRTGKEKYSAFLAEIKAESPRVFSLNLERQTFIKVQFLYEERRAEERSLLRKEETFMLVMLHRESIGLYKIPLAKTAIGMVMRGQPKTEQVGKRFCWCQWEAGNQQLFYIHPRKDGGGVKQYMLTCVQMYSSALYDNVIDVPLNFPFVSRSSGRCSYIDIPLHPGIPDSSINACVLTQGNGTFCVCYQSYVSSSERRSKSSPLPRTSPLSRNSPLQQSSNYSSMSSLPEVESTDVNYYVCMVHHAKTLHGCVSDIPESVVKKALLSFAWLGDMVMVLLPGHFVHLLNVGMEFEPCHHILMHGKTLVDGTNVQQGESTSFNRSHDGTSSQSGADLEGISVEMDQSFPALGQVAESIVLSSNCSKVTTAGVLQDRSTGYQYRVSVNMASMIKLFTRSCNPMTRSALLHYAIMKQKGFALIKQLFAILCNDIPSPEVPSLMTEFLISMTYIGMKRQIDREVLRLLPFTQTEPFRGQFDKTTDGRRLARVSYSPIHSVNILTKNQNERQQKKGILGDDWLDTLRNHLRWMQVQRSHRFMFETVMKAYKQIYKDKEKDLLAKEEENFLTMLRIPKSTSVQEIDTVSHFGSKFEAILGSVPTFLLGTSATEVSDLYMTLTREVLAKHLTLYLVKDAKVKANIVAKEYVSCQIQQSRLLCHLLWTLRGQYLEHGNHYQRLSLKGKVSFDEYEMFQLYERYITSTGELAFPVQLGFQTYFASLAFRCLNIRQFKQYVDFGIIQLTGDFMAQLITDLPDDSEGHQVKQFIISKLPLSMAEACYKMWGHNTSNSYLAHHHVSRVLAESTQKTGAGTLEGTRKERRNSVIDRVTFQPLAAFFRHLNKAEESHSERLDRRSPLDFLALEEVALFHTAHETNYDMGTVNF